ncbi:hypothetical protein HNV08_06090 [Winogradskyella eckloniae]|uniref:hypothetical protein n=1 Tax=Winogradskyella eckloniae TaxID=1089306 RepID=UPI001565ADF1|nr:hypothetical protein [Winogradskyella eckloniae]NRD19610.1 hypothetical protein [Winogradskyella eckloniae]
MKTNLITYFLLLTLMVFSCKPKQNLTNKTTFPKFIGNELDFLGSYKTSSEIENEQSIFHYDSLNLKTVRNEIKYEFWIDELLVYSIATDSGNQCRIIEVFKKNFILISSGSCGIATPDFVDRNDVKVIDINSHKIYSFSLNNLRLTRSIEMSKLGYPKSKKYFGVLNFDLESNKLKIYNQYTGVMEIDLNEN